MTTVVACVKWVAHPGEPADERYAGMSPADRSALEFALRQAEAMNTSVTVITVGPAGADHVVREALACGAARALRIDTGQQPTSSAVAAAIAAHISAADWVWCGDYSLDRGTGSVPAFLAAHLDARQALGVLSVDPAHGGHGEIGVTRRLDGGRRELLTLSAPAVISVEGATSTLRRASLAAVRAAARAEIEVVPLDATAMPEHHEAAVLPYRPRARAVAAPAGLHPLDRLRTLTDTSSAGGASSARGEHLELSPADAAARILAALQSWGYLTTHD